MRASEGAEEGEAVKRRYHHGNLAAALVNAGLELAAVGGPNAVTVREAARRAGVTAPAAYRHFVDRDDLLAEVARRCREQLARAMIEARDRQSDPAERLLAAGRAYVRFAIDAPGLIECAFGAPNSAVPDDPDSFAVLVAALDELDRAGRLPADRRPGAEIVAWSAVHGIAMLLARSPVGQGADAADVQNLIERVLVGVRDALGVRADPST